jgi:hypothetical protein
MKTLISFLSSLVVIAMIIIILGWLLSTNFLILDLLLMLILLVIYLALPLVLLLILIWIYKKFFKK